MMSALRYRAGRPLGCRRSLRQLRCCDPPDRGPHDVSAGERTGYLRLDPPRPLPGALIRASYTPAAALQGFDSLVLRARSADRMTTTTTSDRCSSEPPCYTARPTACSAVSSTPGFRGLRRLCRRKPLRRRRGRQRRTAVGAADRGPRAAPTIRITDPEATRPHGAELDGRAKRRCALWRAVPAGGRRPGVLCWSTSAGSSAANIADSLFAGTSPSVRCIPPRAGRTAGFATVHGVGDVALRRSNSTTAQRGVTGWSGWSASSLVIPTSSFARRTVWPATTRIVWQAIMSGSGRIRAHTSQRLSRCGQSRADWRTASSGRSHSRRWRTRRKPKTQPRCECGSLGIVEVQRRTLGSANLLEQGTASVPEPPADGHGLAAR